KINRIRMRYRIPKLLILRLSSIAGFSRLGGRHRFDQIRTVVAEDWLWSIPKALGAKSKIRNTMSPLYNHAIRWEFIDRNPITGPVRGSGVRQRAKRERIPDVLESLGIPTPSG